jgi:hypothetical protein
MIRDRVDLRLAKRAAAEGYLPGAPGRELILGLADEMEVAAFDSLLAVLVRLLRTRGEGGARW